MRRARAMPQAKMKVSKCTAATSESRLQRLQRQRDSCNAGEIAAMLARRWRDRAMPQTSTRCCDAAEGKSSHCGEDDYEASSPTADRHRRKRRTWLSASCRRASPNSGKRDLPITAADSTEKCKHDSQQMPIEPRRLRMEWIAERGDMALTATSIWQINCDIGEKTINA